MRYWQIAAGASGRDYKQSFLDYGMAFVGGRDNRNTMMQVKPGDCIVLKKGKSQVVAAGRVVERNGQACCGDGDKEWLKDFDGWDLSAYCLVDWHEPQKPLTVDGLTRSTIQRINKRSVQDEINPLLNLPAKTTYLAEPSKVDDLEDEEMLDALVYYGLRPAAAVELTATLNRIRRLAHYYYKHCSWENVREHEARTFLIIPFLIALGWSEQQIKIELAAANRERVDIACFSKPYGRKSDQGANNSDCVLLLESKGFQHGLDYAQKQGKNYAATFPSCEVVVASNGYCYKAFLRNKDESGFSSKPAAYLNLLRPCKKYPLDPENVEGGVELLKYLLPQHWLVKK